MSKVTCKNCNKPSVQFDTFKTLDLEIPPLKDIDIFYFD